MTVIVGAGPVGLFAALCLARKGPVNLIVKHSATVATTRIDSVPMGLLALLVEFGIPPERIAASASHQAMLVAWETEQPQTHSTPPKAHIDRHLLERELWRRVEGTTEISVTNRVEDTRDTDRKIIDATGRAAWSARDIVRPQTPWIAKTVSLPGRFGAAHQALRIAALPEGYIYRSALPDLMTLGFVGPARWHREIDVDPNSALHALGLRWMLAGLAPDAQWQRARGGVASLQWTRGMAGVARLGDANLACDALASQGIALGMSDALAVARDGYVRPRLEPHVANLRATITRCRYAHLPTWRAYSKFLDCSSEEHYPSAITQDDIANHPIEI